jgi:hypothetical protein
MKCSASAKDLHGCSFELREGFNMALPFLRKPIPRAFLKAVRFYNDALKDGILKGPTAEVVSILTE